MVGSFNIFLILIVGIIVLLLTNKIHNKYLTLIKDYIIKFLGKPQSGDSIKWSKNSFFIKGFFVSLLLYFMFRFIFPVFFIAILLNIIIATVLIKKSKKYTEYKSEKIKSYIFGNLLVTLFFVAKLLIILFLDSENWLAFLSAKDGQTIFGSLFLIVALFIIGQIYTKKSRLLKNTAATAYTEGKITRITKVQYSIVKFITYEYEFVVNGTVYNGVSGESERIMKKRETQLSETQKILYVYDNPTISKLEAVKDKKLSIFYMLWFLLIFVSILNCIVTTDLLQIL